MMCSENNGCENTNSDSCPIGMCNSCQCCSCYFNCPVENKEIEIIVFETTIKNTSESRQFALSDFSSDCWQPPKFNI